MLKIALLSACVFLSLPSYADKYARGRGEDEESACDAAKDAAKDEQIRTVNGPFRHNIKETSGCRCSRIPEESQNDEDDKYRCAYGYLADFTSGKVRFGAP